MLTKEEVQEHVLILELQYKSDSPFQGKIDFNSEGGLLTLPIPEQQQVHDAMTPALKRMVFGDERDN